MRWMKWAMIAAAGLPAFARAEEKKTDDSPIQVKVEDVKIEIQGEDGKRIILLGEDNDNPKAGAKPTTRPIVIKPRTGGGFAPGQPMQFRINVREGKTEKVTFLGVNTSDPQPVLRKQLGLAKGMGLVVDHIEKGSPADKAGLQEFDVLQKLDDQLVINREQLAVLVHSHKNGDDVKLTVIRSAKPTTLTVKLAEHEVAAGEGHEQFGMVEHHLRDLLNHVGPGGAFGPMHHSEWRGEGHHGWWHHRDGEHREGFGGPRGWDGWRPHPGQEPQWRPWHNEPQGQQGPGRMNPGGAIGLPPRPLSKTLIEGDRTYTLNVTPWSKMLIVTEGKDHKPIFNGLVTTKEQREKVPADMQPTLEKLEKSLPQSPQMKSMPGAGAPNPAPQPNPAPKKEPKKDKDADEK